jgi:predicted Zn-dependent peptidase
MNNDKFEKTQRTDPQTGVTVQTFRHTSGLTLHRIPKKRFSKKFAGILVPFGSIHNQFETAEGKAEFPAGTAHYLEHCIFSKEEEGGLLSRLSALGVSANAYTSHTHTMYYFTTVDHFTEAFELYFNAVTHPYLEQDRIDAERAIILQELEMYQDDPENRCFANLIESLYSAHPVRIDIGGTKESVIQILPGHLKRIRRSFYTPEALTVTVAGDIGEEEILSVLARCLDGTGDVAIKRPVFIYPDETEEITCKSKSVEMDVSAESFLVGIKNPTVSTLHPISGREKVVLQKGGQLFFEMILGSSSEIFETLYSEGLVNDSFSFQYVCEETYSYIAMGGESPEPARAAKKLHTLVMAAIPALEAELSKGAAATAEDIQAEPGSFELQKRVEAGDFVRSLDSVEHCGMSAAIAEMSGLNIFDYPEIYDKMELERVIDSMRFIRNPALETESFIFKKRTVH